MAVSSGSTRKTFHIVLDTNGFEDAYKVGDSIGILPTNDPKEVADILSLTKSENDEEFRFFLTRQANLTKLNRALLNCTDVCFENTSNLTLKDLLRKAPLSKRDIVKHAMPLLPRFYSIASSQKVVPNELHILVAHVQYEIDGQTRTGVGSDFLGVRAEIGTTEIPFYVQPSNHFTLPEDPLVPIIMIGPGTGVAPFRAFMQERVANKNGGKNWLFFGERNEKTDFYYESFWKDLEKQGALRLDTAFSRDTGEKVYVQDKVRMRKKALWEWIQEGALIYICGDAKNMAREVEIALCQIIKEEGGMSEEQALHFFRKMRRERRYLADVY